MSESTKARKKPVSLVYGVDDTPPLALTLLNAVQHTGVIAINLIYPVLVFSLLDIPVPVVVSFLTTGMLVLAIGTMMQALRGPIGSGYLCPSTFTATYLAPSLLAAKVGGLPLVFGMTAFAGVVEAALAPMLNRLRPIFPPEISGLVIFMIGWSASIAGLRLLLGNDVSSVDDAEWWVAAFTLFVMVALNVWGKGMVRMLCALIGLILGYIAAALTGLFDQDKQVPIAEAPWVGLPTFGHVSWSFDLTLAAPFAIAAVAAAMKALGTVTVCQRTNDADWVRPDMPNATRGVLADGASTTIAGLLGAVGTNTSSPSAGLAAATGMASRKVAYAIAGIFLLLALLPKVSAALAVMPRSVMMAGLLFAMSSVIINGIQIMSSRLLDVRRTLVIAFSIVAGTAIDIFPMVAESAPAAAMPVLGSSLVFSTLLALGLNLAFRLGVKKTVTLPLDMTQPEPEKIETFLKRQGAAWGARPDVVNRAVFGVIQLIDAVRESCTTSGSASLRASFDEFNLDIRVSYEGDALEFPESRPSNKVLRETADGVRLLAGYMLRRSADRIRSQSRDRVVTVYMHYDH